MRFSRNVVMLGVMGLAAGVLGVAPVTSSAVASARTAHPAIDCSKSRTLCTEVGDSEMVWGEGHYVGHDEPSLLFYSNRPGSGNRMQYSGIIPKDPPAKPLQGRRSYNFQLYIANWFGMVMCDTQSYPEQLKTCRRDSDTNITKPGAVKHAGAAYMELQFYPPGYVPQWNGASCSARKWCVALTIDSLSWNPVTNQLLNDTCANRVGLEYVNYAFLTHSGKPLGPPNPVNFNPATSGAPQTPKTLFLNPGDHYTLTMHDTAHGLLTKVRDTTTGRVGSMIASAANGFGQVKFAPNPSKQCQNIPYDFHPMYSTSSPRTTVPWAAATYNVAIDTEIGHFDYCSRVPAPGASCAGREDIPYLFTEPADGDDNYCFPGSWATRVKVSGCLDSNLGFDGTSYKRDWPNGNRNLRPSPTIFTSPTTGLHYRTQYSRTAFNTDLPRIEDDPLYGGTCNRETGAGCTRIPKDDDHKFADFYPYYTSGHALGGCAWTVGQTVPGFSTRTYGKNAEYGHILRVTYTGPGGTLVHRYNDYQKILPSNPCPRR